EFILLRQAYLIPGKHEAELMISEGNTATLVTSKFYYNSTKSILNDNTLASTNEFPLLNQAIAAGELLKEFNMESLAEIARTIESGGGASGGGTVPSNVILYEDWAAGETVIIDTGNTAPPPDTTAPILIIAPNGGTFATTQSVTMSTNETAEIFYTLDGSTPTVSSTKYTSAINLSNTATIKAIAKDTAGNISAVNTVAFTKDVTAPTDTTPPVLTVSPAAGTYTTSQSVTLTANETADIYYTLDGTTPTTASIKYSSPFTVSATSTVKAFAKDTAGNSSVVQTVAYTIDTVPATLNIVDTFSVDKSLLTTTETGQTWVPSNYGVTGGQFYAPAPNASTYKTPAYITVPSNSFTVEVDYAVPHTGTNTYSAIMLRWQDISNMVYIYISGTKYRIGKWQAGAYSTIIEWVGTATANDKLKIEHQADGHIKLFVNGNLAIEATETFLLSSTNKVGLGTSNAIMRFDNFSVKSLA
ncbi:chitobiase/beta-hexosaminidase C-terminal domain-containing protein, partial [Bacillus sp. mrc49]